MKANHSEDPIRLHKKSQVQPINEKLLIPESKAGLPFYSTQYVHRIIAVVATSAIAIIAGCGGSSSKTIIGNPSGVASLPAPLAPGPANTYIGTQSPGVWTLSLDDTKTTYSYQPTTFPNSPNTPITGTFQNSNGFLNLGQANGASLGYILEVPGRMAILRPGDTTAPLVVGVPQTTCYSIPYRLRFDYIGMQAGPVYSGPSPLAQGSFVANTNTDGSAWQYQNLQGNAPAGPAGFTGTCSAANSQTVMSLSGQGIFNQYNYETSFTNSNLPFTDLTTTLQMGPSGIFIVDQSLPKSTSTFQGASAAGVAQPSSSLSTSDVAAASYLGFLTETATPTADIASPFPGFTSPISFGQTASSGTTMVGGIFPNDDVTQTPNADISINLGKQDSAINGLYSSATVTVLDPAQACTADLVNSPTDKVAPGINADGFFTCTFPAIAVVGNPDGKYAIFLTTYNYTINTVGTPMQIYLYQQ
jgi:hypothetical protein